MNYKYIKLEKNDEFTTVIFNRVESLNSLNTTMLLEIEDAISKENIKESKCLVFRSASEKSFIAGADINEMVNFSKDNASKFSALGKSVFNHIEQLPIPTIALIDGYTLGGGLELALACDIRVCSSKSKFGLPEVTLGIFPGFDGIKRLERIIGESNAKYLVYSGSILDAKTANSLGLINFYFDKEDFSTKSSDIIKNIVKNPKQSLNKIKFIFNERLKNNSFDDSNLFGECFETDIQTNMMNNFLKK